MAAATQPQRTAKPVTTKPVTITPVTTKPVTTRQATTRQTTTRTETRTPIPMITAQPMTQVQEAERPAQATAW